MADFDLTQTDQQVQNILNDAQGAMGASAQTTLTTEYVMLKDTNGVYHKILKSSFTEAIRDVLAGLLVNNDKGTTINQIAAIASGDFGSITPANLASVLGATYSNVNLTVTDFFDTNREIPASTLASPGRYIHIKISTTIMADHWYEIALGYSWVAPASADNVIFVRRRDGSDYTAWKQVTTTLVS